MSSKHTRLDRFISKHSDLSRRDVRLALANRRICVDGELASEINHRIGPFSKVTLDKVVLQDTQPIYLMMNKPTGVVSATKDRKNTTVFDCMRSQIDGQPNTGIRLCKDLHIVGRLDFNSSGLLLMTNDGGWSRGISAPDNDIFKHYQVTLEKPVTPTYVEAFAKGMYFPYENITTRPATLNIIDNHHVEVILSEGKYHQIKRMFGRFQNKVLTLHRSRVGDLHLDPSLLPGESRLLNTTEIQALI